MAIDMLIRKKWDKFSLDINFKSQSKRIGILGASGCGKSMTLKSIAGIETPDSGRCRYYGGMSPLNLSICCLGVTVKKKNIVKVTW